MIPMLYFKLLFKLQIYSYSILIFILVLPSCNTTASGMTKPRNMPSESSEQLPTSASKDKTVDEKPNSSTSGYDTLFSWRPSLTSTKHGEQNRSRYFDMEEDITQASASAFATSLKPRSRPRWPKGIYKHASSTQEMPRKVNSLHTTPHTPSSPRQSFTCTTLSDEGWVEMNGTIGTPSSVVEANISIALRFEMPEVELEKTSSAKEREQVVVEAVQARARRALEKHMTHERCGEM